MVKDSVSDFLQESAAASAERCADARSTLPEHQLQFDPAPPVSFDANAFHVVAELKRRSPAEGTLSSADLSLEHVARSYAGAGASAISVLTEPDRFSGSLDDIDSISHAVQTPVMRKDFLVDPYQILEARAHGACGALIIVRIAHDRHHAMIDAAATTNCFLLLEAFDRSDLDRAVELAEYADARHVTTLLGVNCRNLSTLAVEPQRFEKLAGHLPTDRIVIAESGMHNAADVRAVAGLGYRGALVGTALMRAPDATLLITEMRTAGSSGVTSCA